jgi:two-component system, chemotaxis family, response regulator WspF
MGNKLLTKIASIRKLVKPPVRKVRPPTFDRPSRNTATVPLIAIGSSTGGPKVLATILSRLPNDLNAAIVIIQHLDLSFSSGFADWLQGQTKLPIRLAVAGDRFTPGNILIAGTNDHLYLKADLTLSYTKDPIDYPYRPSVDVFFNSIAQNWTGKGTGILLTGMGRDGAEGLNTLKQKGWQTIAQDKESCIVYGMPKAAIALNAAVQVLSPDRITDYILQHSNRSIFST